MSEHTMPPPSLPPGYEPPTAAPISELTKNTEMTASVDSHPRTEWWHHHHGTDGTTLEHHLGDPMHEASGEGPDHRHLLIYGRRQQRGRARFGSAVHDHRPDAPTVTPPESP